MIPISCFIVWGDAPYTFLTMSDTAEIRYVVMSGDMVNSGKRWITQSAIRNVIPACRQEKESANATRVSDAGPSVDWRGV